jgi:hypothetical protein
LTITMMTQSDDLAGGDVDRPKLRGCAMPVASAILGLLQWVATLRLGSMVLVIRLSTSLSVTLPGEPGRSWTASAAVCRSENRLRDMTTVWMVTLSLAPTYLACWPQAHARMILARSGSCRVLLGLASQVLKIRLSPLVRVNSELGRPFGVMSLL